MSTPKVKGRPKGTGGQSKALTPDEIRRIDLEFSGPYETRNRAIFFWGLGTGMRISEIVGLRLKDVAPHGKVLSEIVLEKHSTKGKKSRTVYVSKQAQTTLDHYLRERGDLDNLEACVFQGKRGPLTPKGAARMLNGVFRDAGVCNATSHSLRRTHANTLRRKGVDLRIIQKQLGHSRLSTTAAYLAVDPEEMTKAVEDLRF